jgi:hypothetical protein
MQTNGNAVIETNDLVCEHFAGSFNEVRVSAECDLTLTFCRREYCIASSKLIALMARFDSNLKCM